MINKIILKNFQIHKHLELNIQSGLTTLCGANDSGKSSIVRAIYWLFYNEPSGDWMRRIDADGNLLETTVKIIFEDGTIISRIKGNKINRYIVDGDEYDNFGVQVPEQVKEKLKINEFKTNKTSFNLNVAMQDEKSFLVHESAPVKASVLDVLTGNSILQKAISEFNKESLSISRDITFAKEVIEISTRACDKLPNLKLIQKKLDKADLLQQKINKQERKLQSLKDLKNRYRNYKQVLENCVDESKIGMEDIVSLYNKIHEHTTYLKSLKETVKRYKQYKKVKPLAVDVSDLPNLNNTYLNTLQNLQGLKQIRDRREKLISTLSVSAKTIEDYTKEIEELKSKNPVCPTCGKSI